jgi:hypothetical protein
VDEDEDHMTSGVPGLSMIPGELCSNDRMAIERSLYDPLDHRSLLLEALS